MFSALILSAVVSADCCQAPAQAPMAFIVSRAPAGPACAAAAGPACVNGSCGMNATAVHAGQPMYRTERRGLFNGRLFKGRGFHLFGRGGKCKGCG